MKSKVKTMTVEHTSNSNLSALCTKWGNCIVYARTMTLKASCRIVKTRQWFLSEYEMVFEIISDRSVQFHPRFCLYAALIL